MSGRRNKVFLDFILYLLLLLLMGYHLWGEVAHEIIGSIEICLFLLHNIINRKWYANIWKGNHSPIRAIIFFVDMLLILSILSLAISALPLSQHLFTLIPLNMSLRTARAMHMMGAYWTFFLVSLHLGLHLGPHFRKGVKSYCLLALFSIYGLHALIARGLPSYMTLQTEFVFFDYSENPLFFYLDYLAISALGCFISVTFLKIFTRRTK